MASLNPYLMFPGTCEEAFNFYKSVFGGEFLTVMRMKEMPSDKPIPDNIKEKIMHIALPMGDNPSLLGSDNMNLVEEEQNSSTGNFAVVINAESEDEAQNFFDGLSAGGKIIMPMEKTFWNSYFGMVIDKYAVQWMISYEFPQ